MAQSPSFACTGNLLPAEAVICSDATLSGLDRTLAADYAARMRNATAAEQNALRSAEERWLVERNSCGTNKSCIANAYKVRISELGPAPAPPNRNSFKPSFACTGNLLPTEAVICSDENLAALDRTLAVDYANRMRTLSGVAKVGLEDDEKAWLAERNSCGTNKSCISNAYQVRINELTGR
jgi:uncharacterized protein